MDLPKNVQSARSLRIRRKWSSAYRVVQSLHRFKNPPQTSRYEPQAGKFELSNAFNDCSVASNPTRGVEIVDPIYLALKQATDKYTRRSAGLNNESATPSPRNLSDASLQDFGYAEVYSGQCADGLSAQLDQSTSSQGRRRAPKLHKQMKSLSLDCAELPQAASNNIYFTKKRTWQTPSVRLINSSGDIFNYDNNQYTSTSSPRSTPSIHSATTLQGTHVVTHEYVSPSDFKLHLGDRMRVVDNGDPDWLYGIKIGDRQEHLSAFPSTCVALLHPGEQPMLLKQSVNIPEAKIRLYRDQVVFAQAESLVNGRLRVRTERNAIVDCPVQYFAIL